jgi:hypothetical protein
MRNKNLTRNDSAREHAMSQPVAAALAPLPFGPVYDNGEPLETEWHTFGPPSCRRCLQALSTNDLDEELYLQYGVFEYDPVASR